LQYIFGGDIPSERSYLKCDADRAAIWRSRLGKGGVKIAVCWQSAERYEIISRSFAPAYLLSIAALPGVRLISVNKRGADSVEAVPGGDIEDLGDDFDAGPDAFRDTAAVLTCCDLVITSDTAVAHLAGALGVTTWLALKHVPDCRWRLDRSDSPWYPTMRLFRQPKRGDWRSVFGEMEGELRTMLDLDA
jgi:hypothetical protein